jgi:hypothetical protein
MTNQAMHAFRQPPGVNGNRGGEAKGVVLPPFDARFFDQLPWSGTVVHCFLRLSHRNWHNSRSKPT